MKYLAFTKFFILVCFQLGAPCPEENWCDRTIPKVRKSIKTQLKNGKLKPGKIHFATAMAIFSKCSSDKKSNFLLKSDFEKCIKSFNGNKMLQQIIKLFPEQKSWLDQFLVGNFFHGQEKLPKYQLKFAVYLNQMVMKGVFKVIFEGLTEQSLTTYLQEYINGLKLPVFAKSFMKTAMSKEIDGLYKKFGMKQGSLNIDRAIDEWLLPKIF